MKHDFDFKWKFKKKFNTEILNESFKENLSELKNDSSWKIFFPISICFLSATLKNKVYVEKITGASIVNRFPLKILIPIGNKKISERHLKKNYILSNIKKFDNISINLISQNYSKSIHFKDKMKNVINNQKKISLENSIIKNSSISFHWTKKELKGVKIYKLKSHSLLFLNIKKIFINNHLKDKKIIWQSLPKFLKKFIFNFKINQDKKYHKGFTDNYKYEVSFQNVNYIDKKKNKKFTEVNLKSYNSKKIQKLSSDQAKWPIFFPSSLGIIGSLDKKNNFNFMPCGSTTVVNRHPFQFATAVSHLNNNIRYRKRYSLNKILKFKKITLGIPFSNEKILKMINYMGNISKFDYKNKIQNTVFKKTKTRFGPIFSELPITYGCILSKKIKFETHFLLIFTLKKVFYSKKFNNSNLMWNGLFKLSKK